MPYASAADLGRFGLPAPVLAEIGGAAQDAALAAASALADGYLARRFTLPITAWGDDLRRAVCHIAAYDLMAERGYSPEGTDTVLRLRYEDALRWLERVAMGAVAPAGLVDSTPAVREGPPAITTDPLRGW